MFGWEESLKEYLGRKRAPRLVPCASCGQRVPPSDTGTCTTCSKPICTKCGTVVSLHYVHFSEHQGGLARTYDEEVARTGTCSAECAQEPVLDAVASCLVDGMRKRLRASGVKVDRSVGIYGPDFVLNLPGLSTYVAKRIDRYCRTEGPRRMPFRYLVQALIADGHGMETTPDGSSRIFIDAIDRSRYVLLRGSPVVLDAAQAGIGQGPGSYWTEEWSRSVKGVAEVLSTAGRFEEAARTYELGDFFAEAGRERAKAPTGGNLSQTIDALVRAFRASDIVSVFRCPSCGASIRFSKDTPDHQLKVCSYCGNEFRPHDMIDFLRAITRSAPSPAKTP